MNEGNEVYNGIDGSTGLYLPVPGTREDFRRILQNRPLDPRSLRAYRWWIERYGIDDPNRAPARNVNPNNLAQAGWGVIWAPQTGSDIRRALAPLLDLRRRQAGPYFKQLDYRPKESKLEFLLRYGAGSGPADPKNVPYYLLIVGDPGSIPFRFQYELDVQYAVGRIHFDQVKDYECYARSVEAVELGRERRRPKRVSFFGTRNPDDRPTRRTADNLVKPLAESLASKGMGDWTLDLVLGEKAKKDRLLRLLGGAETPGLLLTACHGMWFSEELRERQVRHQGALLCQDWPGPVQWKGRIPPEQYFSVDDVSDEADLLGLIVFHFACFSAGTPRLSDFDFSTLGNSRPVLAERDFLAPLAQRLLSHPKGGALAVIGHVDRTWTTSFELKADKAQSPFSEEEELGEEEKAGKGQVEVFDSMFQALLEGAPIGAATEYINQRHAELAVELSGWFADLENEEALRRSIFFRAWRANNDAKNFIVLGDPAVRLMEGVSSPVQVPEGGEAAS